MTSDNYQSEGVKGLHDSSVEIRSNDPIDRLLELQKELELEMETQKELEFEMETERIEKLRNPRFAQLFL